MWLPNLADESWLADVVTAHAAALGVAGPVDSVRLLDARLTHPHRPESALCRGWATCVVSPRDGAAAELYVKGFPDDDTTEEAWRRDRVTRPHARSVRLPGHDLVVWPFPDDPHLPSVPILVDPRRVADVLPPPVREVLGAGEPRTTVVRYQPEASITLRLDTGGDGAPAVFAKHLADGEVKAAGTRHEAVWHAARDHDHLRVAEPLATDDHLGVLWTRGVPGLPLTTAVAPSELVDLAVAMGATLAALHRTPTDAPLLTVDALLAEMDKKAGKLSRAHPAVGPTVSRMVTAAARRRTHVRDEQVVTLHGDFHLDQLVSSDAGPVVVDLDSMVRGAKEVDLAEFLVDLALRGLPDDVVRSVGRRLLASYADAADREIDQALLETCADAEFVNRCYRHLRRHANGWQDALTAELERHADVVALLRG